MQMRAAVARENREALPPTFDLRAFEREVALLTALEACLTAASQLQADVRDTFLMVGKGTMHTGKIAYGYLQVVAQAGGDIKRAVQNLKLRSRRAKPEATAAPNPGAESATASGSAGPAATASGPSAGPPLTIVPPAAEGEDGSKTA